MKIYCLQSLWKPKKFAWTYSVVEFTKHGSCRETLVCPGVWWFSLLSSEDRGMFSLDRVSHRMQFSPSGTCLQRAGLDCRAKWSLGLSICKHPGQTRGWEAKFCHPLGALPATTTTGIADLLCYCIVEQIWSCINVTKTLQMVNSRAPCQTAKPLILVLSLT